MLLENDSHENNSEVCVGMDDEDNSDVRWLVVDWCVGSGVGQYLWVLNRSGWGEESRMCV